MDMNQGRVNPKLEDVIIKSIAAFSNGEGGLLLIGVADDGSIIGLEGDFSSLKKQGKVRFCKSILSLTRSWEELSEEAQEIVKVIYRFIENHNS